MGHHGQVPAVIRANTGNRMIGTIRISRVFRISILQCNVIIFFPVFYYAIELLDHLTDTQRTAAQTAEHDGSVFRNMYSQECRFEFMGRIVRHNGFPVMTGNHQVEFHHELATVANAKA